MQQVIETLAPARLIGVDRDTRLLEGIVRNMAIFREVPSGTRAEIAALARVQELRRGGAAVRWGKPMPGILFVAYGLLKLALPNPNGEERVLRFVGPHESFGEAPTLLDRPAPFDAVALDDSMLVVIPRAPVLCLLEQHPAVGRKLVDALAEGYLGLLADLRALAQHRGMQRLAAYLLSLSNGRPANGAGAKVRLPASKTAIAARLSVQKETLSRMLRKLSKLGCIRVEGRVITILDRASLSGLAA